MKHIATVVLSLSLLVTGSALAAPGNDHGRNAGHGQPQHPPVKAVAPGPRQQVQHAPPRVAPPLAAQRPVPPPPRFVAGPKHGPHAPPPPRMGQVLRRGDYLPPQARGYRVANHQRYGLRPPPRGHEWRRIDGRDVLLAVATGVIAEIIFR